MTAARELRFQIAIGASATANFGPALR